MLFEAEKERVEEVNEAKEKEGGKVRSKAETERTCVHP